MERGWIRLWRKTLDSGMLQNPQLWAFWGWCLLKASHKPIKHLVGFQEIALQPGQLIFGRQAAAKELKTTEKKIRTCLEKLKKMGNLAVQSSNKFSIITVINWETYQEPLITEGQQKGQHRASTGPAQGHKQECKDVRNKKTSPRSNSSNGGSSDSVFSELLSRYSPSERETIQEAFKAIALTRTSGRVKESILIAELRYWSEFETWKVVGGIRKYLEQEHHLSGKKEHYLRGIIRGMRPTGLNESCKAGTGSTLLDAYYQEAQNAG